MKAILIAATITGLAGAIVILYLSKRLEDRPQLNNE